MYQPGMSGVFQTSLPYDTNERPLPGVQPLDDADWLVADEAFSGQMAERDRLISGRRGDVIVLDPGAAKAAEELLDLVVEKVYPGAGNEVTRSDGVVVPIDRGDPLATLGRLVQEDFVILQSNGIEHVLTGAVVCFPASWSLPEKFMKPLVRIHDPVASYDADIARRVQRLFDGVRCERPMWRRNVLWYSSADLFHPLAEHEKRKDPGRGRAPYLRSERQCIRRLPESHAVVFSIHTYLLRAEDVRPPVSD